PLAYAWGSRKTGIPWLTPGARQRQPFAHSFVAIGVPTRAGNPFPALRTNEEAGFGNRLREYDPAVPGLSSPRILAIISPVHHQHAGGRQECRGGTQSACATAPASRKNGYGSP